MSKMRKIETDLDIITAVTPISGKHIIDVGCGTGDLVRQMAAAGAVVTGIDSAVMVEKASAYPQTGAETYRTGGGQGLPLPNASADMILFIASLHHVPQPVMGKALQEAHRVLKPRGVVIILEPVPEKGSYFELTGSIEDETPILKAAYQVIRQARETRFRQISEEKVYFNRSFRDFRDLLDKYIHDPASRAAYFAKIEPIAQRISREAGVDLEAYRFKSIARVNVLKRI